jgi:dihydropteroate synthase
MQWNTTRFLLDLTSPKVMGIVNVTPDSFSDGGQHATTVAALQHCERLLQDGADILDIGGESSRPGARPITLEEELARVLPVVRDAVKLGVPISVDSYKPKVMRAVLDLGVDIINDIYALRWTETLADSSVHQIPDALSGMQVVSEHPSCGVCLMHMHRDPFSMQVAPMQGDVVSQVRLFLLRTAQALEQQGVNKDRIVIDPGIGFGKTLTQNFALLARQSELLSFGYPVLAGWSRKSSLTTVIGTATGSGSTVDAQERMVASVAAALLAVERGASIVRVHDVRETVLAIKVLGAIK